MIGQLFSELMEIADKSGNVLSIHPNTRMVSIGAFTFRYDFEELNERIWIQILRRATEHFSKTYPHG